MQVPNSTAPKVVSNDGVSMERRAGTLVGRSEGETEGLDKVIRVCIRGQMRGGV